MLGASLLAVGLASFGAAAPDPAECPHEAGPARLTALTAQAPGEPREDVLDVLCTRLDYTKPKNGEPQVSLSLSGPESDADLSPAYPAGTTVRATIESSGGRPLTAVVTARNARARFRGGSVVVQGLTTPAKYALRYRNDRPFCRGETTTFRSYFDTVVLLDSPGSGIRPYRGSSFGSNAQSLSFPFVSDDGAGLELFLSGCGDERKRTREGYFQGFLPVTGLAKLGLDRELLLYVPNDVLDFLLALEDNGSPSPRVHFRRITRYGVLGVAFDYRLSYSFHRVRAKAIRRALRVARACRRSGGELRIVRRRLVCQNR